MKKLKRATKYSKFEWKKAPDVKVRLRKLIKNLEIDYIKPNSIHTYRSANSKTRAYARIWGLSKLWQEVLEVRPTYIIEVLSQHFDDLSEKEKDNYSRNPERFIQGNLKHPGSVLYAVE